MPEVTVTSVADEHRPRLDTAHDEDVIYKEISTILSTIILIASHHDSLAQNSLNDLSSNLSSITMLVLELRKVIGDKTLHDFELLCPPSETPFDGKWMVDYHRSDGSSDAEPIFCTTGLGLRRTKRVTLGQSTRPVENILLMPRVVLQSVVADILAPV